MRYATLLIALLLACLPATARADLKPDELLLIVNGNAPNGRRLADEYAKARGVPTGHVVTLKLPVAEEMELAAYDQWVVDPLRQWLSKNDPQGKIRCLVTFQGVPLKLAARRTNAAEQAELADLKQKAGPVTNELSAVVLRIERAAQKLDPAFARPTLNGTVNDLAARLAAAGKAIDTKLPTVAPADRSPLLASLRELKQDLTAPVYSDGNAEDKPDAKPPVTPDELRKLVDQPDAAAARAGVRQAAQYAGLLAYARALEGQIARLDVADTDSCLDSELALLNWPHYDRRRWQVNPLFYGVPAQARRQVPKTMMVSRIDGPSEEIARGLFATAVAVEKDGLRGKIVIDSRGLKPGGDGYGVYDQTLRNLALIIQSKTTLTLVHDDTPALFRPDVNPQTDVALYCGWYSVNNYIPAFTFARGAVGFHVASFEMTTLRSPANRGWVPGLLRDGITATLGPVSEPFLTSFPRADDFFPLLLTGKLTLAEVYWSTVSMCSWKQGLIGDPLYAPYRVDPSLKVEDLPARLRVIFAVQPAN